MQKMHWENKYGPDMGTPEGKGIWNHRKPRGSGSGQPSKPRKVDSRQKVNSRGEYRLWEKGQCSDEGLHAYKPNTKVINRSQGKGAMDEGSVMVFRGGKLGTFRGNMPL